MANLTLCRVIRGATALPRLAVRSNTSSGHCQELLRKSLSASLLSTCTRSSLVASAGILPRYTYKALPELPSSSMLMPRRAASTTGDHVRLWLVERVVAASFIPLMPACILLENSMTDLLFATLLVMHAHWGLEAVVEDYARPIVIGHALAKSAHVALYALSAITMLGLLTLIYNGDGLGKSVKGMWSIGRDPPRKDS